jgi:hypothetical protein
MALFVFGCLGVDLITVDTVSFTSPELKDIVNTNFSSLLTTLLFLVQFVTMDSIASVYVPLVKAKPSLAIYFGALLLILSVAMMNLILANIVEQALVSAHGDQEWERKIRRQCIREMVPHLEEIFIYLDTDSKNFLTNDQLMEIDNDTLPADMQECFQLESIADLFGVLDIDGSGQVSKEDFIGGIMSFCITSEPPTSFLTRKMMTLLRIEVKQIAEDVVSLKSDILKEPRASYTVV